MECPSCGAHVHPRWEHCRVCGVELFNDGGEHPVSDAEPRLVPPLQLPDVRALGSRLPSALPRRRLSLPALPLVPALRLLPLVGAGAVLGLLVAGLLLLSRELDDARAAQRLARAEIATLQADLREREDSEATLRQQAETAREQQASLLRERDEAREQAAETAGEEASLLRERDEARQQAAKAEVELSRLQAQLREAEGALAEQAEQSATQTAQIDVLRECLGGALVALEFARADSGRSAERAMDAVAEACAQAGAPF